MSTNGGEVKCSAPFLVVYFAEGATLIQSSHEAMPISSSSMFQHCFLYTVLSTITDAVTKSHVQECLRMRSLNFAGRYSATRETDARAQRGKCESALRSCKLVSLEVQFNCGIKSVFVSFQCNDHCIFSPAAAYHQACYCLWMAESLWKTRKVEEESSVVEQPQKIVPFGNERHFFLEFHSY